MNEIEEKFLSYEGRMTRSIYFLSNFLLVIISSIIFNIFIYVLPIISLSWLCIDFMICSCFVVKRCHDMDLSGWYGLFALIPIAHLYFILKDGTRGPNKYGEDPKGRVPLIVSVNVQCPLCNDIYTFNKNTYDITNVKCPYCGVEGVIEKDDQPI